MPGFFASVQPNAVFEAAAAQGPNGIPYRIQSSYLDEEQTWRKKSMTSHLKGYVQQISNAGSNSRRSTPVPSIGPFRSRSHGTQSRGGYSGLSRHEFINVGSLLRLVLLVQQYGQDLDGWIQAQRVRTPPALESSDPDAGLVGWLDRHSSRNRVRQGS